MVFALSSCLTFSLRRHYTIMTRVRKLQERKQLQFENRQSEKKNTYLDNLQPAGVELRVPKFIPPLTDVEDSKTLDVAIVGVPNAGKSTLVNALVGQKVSIVSPKIQTTRTKILGVLTEENIQLKLFDTPGIISPDQSKKHSRELVLAAWKAIETVDYVVAIIDAAKTRNHLEIRLLQQLKENQVPCCLVLNKIDYVKPKSKLLDITEKYNSIYDIETFMISALKKDGIEDLKGHLLSKAKPGEWDYDPILKTDLPDLTVVEEAIREKIFLRSNQEVPYGIYQENVSWIDNEDGLDIIQNVIVGREGQKTILLGPGGTTINWIKEKATEDLEKFFQKNVKLTIHLKVQH